MEFKKRISFYNSYYLPKMNSGNLFKQIYMGVPQLENEFMKYWSKLTIVEKESLLSVSRNYVQSKQDQSDVIDLRKKIIEEERNNYIQGKGHSYNWEQLKNMARNKADWHVI
jgi:hypothetical protein